jgi:ketosteroid isomerase-like protein
MATRERALELLQATYYDSIDRGDMATAAAAMHEDVLWTHVQVWEHHGYRRESGASELRGRAAVEAFLAERRQKLAEAGIRHKLRDLVLEGDKGAFIGAVEGPGPDKLFLVWFEIKDDRIWRYHLRPM